MINQLDNGPIKRRGARKNPSADPTSNPELHEQGAPQHYMLRGVSTLLDGAGNVKGKWVKTQRRQVTPDELRSVYHDALKLVSAPARRARRAPVATSDQVLAVYPLGDPHMGMLAWHRETGKNWDLKLATQAHASAMSELISHAPASDHAVFAPLGDNMHGDGYGNTTTAGTRVDVDVRYPKMLRAAVAMLISGVDQLLGHHQRVTLVMPPGNHDTTSAVAVREVLAAHYRNDPRVVVKENTAAHLYVRWESNLLGFHHGDKTKAKDLPLLMATDRPQLWAKTRHRRWYCGHVHHESVKEHPGCVVETFGTLAPQDAWHAGQGYRSRQRAIVDVLDRAKGKVARYEVSL